MRPIIFIRLAIVLILSGCQIAVAAQFCTGALGDPAVNVSFGSGTNPGTQLQAATTSYNFTSQSCPPDGSYTVVSSTAGCFNSTWHVMQQDHTPNDNNGYMMLVNASYNPGDFYVDTVRDLCANTTYEFAAWITNVLLPTACNNNPILPKLVFKIETITGTVLGTYSTGNIPSTSAPVWKQYGLFFTTPVNTNDVVIRLINTAPGGCGNDLALDDITFRACGPTVTTSVGNNSQPNLDLCVGSITNVPLQVVVGPGYTSPALQWQESSNAGITWMDITGATTASYQFNSASVGNYQYRLAVAEGTNIIVNGCRVASNPVKVTIHDLPVVNAGSNGPVCETNMIRLSSSGGGIYAWTGPSGFSSTQANPALLAQPNSAGQYDVTVTDQFGCRATGSTNVVVNPRPVTTVTGTQVLCEGKTVDLQATGGALYLWSPGGSLSATNISNPVASPTDTTIYQVVVTTANNCSDTASVLVNVSKKPTANAGPDKTIVKGQAVVLEGLVAGADIDVIWSPATFLNNSSLAQPTATLSNDARYTLQVISRSGCGTARDEMFVKLYNDIYIPSAFSPNNDGLNDRWKIETLAAAPNARIIVYSRFGEVVFETTGSNKTWDGTFKGNRLPAGAYTYMIDLKNGGPLKKGTVMLVQ